MLSAACFSVFIIKSGHGYVGGFIKSLTKLGSVFPSELKKVSLTEAFLISEFIRD